MLVTKDIRCRDFRFYIARFCCTPLTPATDPPVEVLTTKDSTETTNKFDWKKVPPVAASPRPGLFLIPPQDLATILF